MDIRIKIGDKTALRSFRETPRVGDYVVLNNSYYRVEVVYWDDYGEPNLVVNLLEGQWQ